MSALTPRARTVLALAVLSTAVAVMVVLGGLRPEPAAFVALAIAVASARGPSATTARC